MHTHKLCLNAACDRVTSLKLLIYLYIYISGCFYKNGFPWLFQTVIGVSYSSPYCLPHPALLSPPHLTLPVHLQMGKFYITAVSLTSLESPSLSSLPDFLTSAGIPSETHISKGSKLALCLGEEKPREGKKSTAPGVWTLWITITSFPASYALCSPQDTRKEGRN